MSNSQEFYVLSETFRDLTFAHPGTKFAVHTFSQFDFAAKTILLEIFSHSSHLFASSACDVDVQFLLIDLCYKNSLICYENYSILLFSLLHGCQFAKSVDGEN